MKKHANLSIFVPHAGCTQQCSFCNQRSISGAVTLPRAQDVTALCEQQLPQAGAGQTTEIAFFGGSFTAMEQSYMEELLAAAQPFVQSTRAAGIRISTRPDAISPAILETLRRFGVTAIELGAQSMSDRVLQLNHRGHTSLQVRFAALQIKNAGFSLGLQMMVGLFGETDPARFARDTALALASLEPDTMRIYPALVLQGTELAQLAAAGAYHPLSVEQAVAATAPLLQLFENKGIRVIRVGLHDEPSLAQQVVAGPYHPAFRQLCEASLYLDEMKSQLKNREEGAYTALVAPGQRSTGAGQKNENLTRLAQLGYAVTIVETAALCGRKVLIQNQKDVKACS